MSIFQQVSSLFSDQIIEFELVNGTVEIYGGEYYDFTLLLQYNVQGLSCI